MLALYLNIYAPKMFNATKKKTCPDWIRTLLTPLIKVDVTSSSLCYYLGDYIWVYSQFFLSSFPRSRFTTVFTVLCDTIYVYTHNGNGKKKSLYSWSHHDIHQITTKKKFRHESLYFLSLSLFLLITDRFSSFQENVYDHSSFLFPFTCNSISSRFITIIITACHYFLFRAFWKGNFGLCVWNKKRKNKGWGWMIEVTGWRSVLYTSRKGRVG